ncbi:MAG: lysine--tRNA ligase [Elusimicrobia bacterium]|nr:lysine--tRNA ligase [Elusimicrobiota bacterium]MBP9699403.1 lysine--tRNA ligase [Elusimicrobiota bacterium]
MNTFPVHTSLDDLMSQRRAKLAALRQGGTNPFPARFDGAQPAASLLARYADLPQGGKSDEIVSVAGRVMTCRDMGKTIFAHLQDLSGKIQVYLRKDELGDEFVRFQNSVDLGDTVGLAGFAFRTRTGEITLHAKTWVLLSKALRPPPEKFHGMTDVDVRYRRREVDLFSNEDVRARFLARQRVVSSLRRTLADQSFIEVETPILQAVAGGAAAKPFETHHNALDLNLSLRIAPELFLKRLIVGGLERVFEIGRAFRNEGIDTRHNPEFTILEAYQAYTDVYGMMDLTEDLIRRAARAVRGADESLEFNYRKSTVDLASPFARVSLAGLFKERLGLDYAALCRDNGWRSAAGSLGIDVDGLPDAKCFDAVLDERILPGLPPAAFLHGYPAALSPLAKASPDQLAIADRFELFLCGEEVANAYSEQNDPDVQRAHFEAQARQRKAGDAEAMPADEEFLIALEHGMPPAGGLGIGVDRLTMILTGADSIREVILFPLLRPHSS